MSESQMVTPIQPGIKISSLDNHRMVSHAAKPRPGTQDPRVSGHIQAPQSGEGPVIMRDAPIEAVMGGGGAIVVAKKAAHSIARQAPHPALAARMTYQPGREPRSANEPTVGLVVPADGVDTRTTATYVSALSAGQVALLSLLVEERKRHLSEIGADAEAHSILDDTQRALATLAELAK